MPNDRLPDLIKSIATNVKETSANEEIFDIVNKHSDLTASQVQIPDYEEIERIFKMDSAVDIIKRLETTDTPFADRTRKMLTKMSPLSIAVVFEQIKRGSKMNIHDVFKMEYKMSQGFMNHPEFFEGVRALLVDKDKNPKWTHKHVSEVKQSEIDFFFNYPADNNLDILKY